MNTAARAIVAITFAADLKDWVCLKGVRFLGKLIAWHKASYIPGRIMSTETAVTASKKNNQI